MHVNIKLQNPLVVFDLETTGVQVAKDRIVEIYCIKIQPDGTEEHLHQVLNPTIPIPVEVSEIHGIWDKDVKDKPTFKDFSHYGSSCPSIFQLQIVFSGITLCKSSFVITPYVSFHDLHVINIIE